MLSKAKHLLSAKSGAGCAISKGARTKLIS